MFKQIITALSLSAALSAQAQDAWTGPDKTKHFGLSLGMGAVGTMAFQSPRAGFVGCMSVGVAKEVYDARTPGNTASVKDLVADAAGCAAGAYLGGLLVVPDRKGVTVGYVNSF
jgi:putative lipoprotein